MREPRFSAPTGQGYQVSAISRLAQVGCHRADLSEDESSGGGAGGGPRDISVDDQPCNYRDYTQHARVLAEFVPTAEELDLEHQYVVDGSLLPCWSWRSDPDLYSGKHKTTGMNIQFACTIDGELAWISDPLPGSRHDSHCLRESGALVGFPLDSWIGDKGYLGLGMITPYRKPAHRDLLDWEKAFNTQIKQDQIRHRANHRELSRPGGSPTPTTADRSTPLPRPYLP